MYAIGLTIVILKVAVGLGFVIFVHELGHFLVAKACGVKCEKFYLGFDFGGLKFCKFRWGETEYGIGVFPLGGYVKMLGQEDNPAKLREEMERAKAEQRTNEGGKSNDAAAPPTSALPPPPTAFDPRSFLAKSVPKRMAIISAGVIMNVVFAFLMAVVAFWIGVKQIPCVVGDVFPGDPAWQANLQVGDEILKVAGKETSQFRDLTTAISLGDGGSKNGVDLLIRRPGVQEPFTITVKPESTHGFFIIGIAPGVTTSLVKEDPTWLVLEHKCVDPGSVADRARPAFENGDTILRIDDERIDNSREISTKLARTADQPIVVVVERASQSGGKNPAELPKFASITVAPSPMRVTGLTMKMGDITAVQADSPAKAAGVLAGDRLLKIDGRPVGDPMTLPARLNRRAGETIELTLQRPGQESPVVVRATLRKPLQLSPSLIFGSPVAASSLGIAYQVLNEIESVTPGSPAAKARLTPGDVIEGARLLPPKSGKEKKEKESAQAVASVPFGPTLRNWPVLMTALQSLRQGTIVELTCSRNDKTFAPVQLTPVEAKDWFNPDRGFRWQPKTFNDRAKSLGEAVALGGRETVDSLTFVFRSVKALGTQRVSARNVAGPWTIILMALHAADEGNARFLLFLTLLSVNLAVINALPIPVLDGGHFVFLLYEWIRGKPADERIQAILSYIGLLLILALMVWAIGLDSGVISRHVPPPK